MGAKTAITEEQYLHTSFPDLDQEYVDGELVERSLPDNLRSRTQIRLTLIFGKLRQDADRFLRTEVRLKLRSGVYRIPDFCVFYPTEPIEAVPEFPPLIVIEILSPDDRMSEVSTKLEQYRSLGIPHVWLVDPNAKRLYACDEGFAQVPTLRVPELGLELKPSDVFERE